MSKAVFERVSLLLVMFGMLTLGACGGTDYAAGFPDTNSGNSRQAGRDANKQTNPGSALGSGGLNIFGGAKPPGEGEGGGGIGVNSFLWRASLDTLGFMPLASADPFGGVIITDWHSPVGSGNERFKVTVYILDRRLRADGVKVAVFKQGRPGQESDWQDEPITPQTVVDLENAILTRARQLRIDAAAR